MAEIPRRVVAVLDTDIRRLLRTYGQRPGSSMVMPFSEDSQSCLNKVRPRTITRSGFRTSSMARNAPRPSVISSGVAGAAAVRFHLHVLDEHTVSHGIPYGVGPG